MPTNDHASNKNAPTQFLTVKDQKYAYRRFGSGPGLPLLCLQHFTGTLDNWDYAVTDPLAQRGEVILFESAGLGRSSGKVPETVPVLPLLKTDAAVLKVTPPALVLFIERFAKLAVGLLVALRYIPLPPIVWVFALTALVTPLI